ncbi:MULTISPECIES: hypothetical protein [Gordonia]|uniref:Uncharacterized protein n=2 Tax=Gordonia sputi TaxID=36823 RepID=H5TVJ1_9ACTN|nr:MULTISPECIES: hypothetical protein [unclassified Gordonia (in: high G+C Gram-positive bacteria)]NKY91808.1 hypothetical protein [Gordonia sputi]OBA38156.1 hypothetical protein A5766_05895 [Gordonia sp. 852002-51296_SCH5728562-b]OBB98927.1 hypothetical protein A5785_21345 [Gordonia sp. 852002-50395_SCH5434458]GAB37499.1 hypothetical protein GOSPT_009_00010 [Gordonia sputi NBRC 100414]
MQTHLIDSPGLRSFIGPDDDLGSFLIPLQQFDGHKLYTELICKLPHPGWSEDFTQTDIEYAKEAFLQVAGSASAMTVEVRFRGGRGIEGLFTVGRPPAADTTSPPSITIAVADHTTLVYPNEVFDATEAANLCFYYYTHDTVPDSYVLRPFTSGESSSD